MRASGGSLDGSHSLDELCLVDTRCIECVEIVAQLMAVNVMDGVDESRTTRVSQGVQKRTQLPGWLRRGG